MYDADLLHSVWVMTCLTCKAFASASPQAVFHDAMVSDGADLDFGRGSPFPSAPSKGACWMLC